MYQLELHFHTDESSRCGKVPAAEGVRMHIEQGYDGLVVTDHFSENALGGPDGDWTEICRHFLRGYHLAKKAAAEAGDFRVYLGMEIRFPHDENDFLVYGMKEDFFARYQWIYMKELPDLWEIAEAERLTIIQAHPFRKMCFPADIRFLHGIEIMNGNPRHDSRNNLAKEMARREGLVGTAGSDFHQIRDLAGCCVRMANLPADEQELARVIREGRFEAAATSSAG